MKPLRTKYLTYHGAARELFESSALYREEAGDALERFRNLDFGSVGVNELIDNTETIANETGMLIGSYKSVLGGYTNIIHNMDFGKTIITFVHVVVKCSHFGF